MNDRIQAVILAGGEGTRLRPLTNTRPKPLLPILGRPCVEYVIRSLADADAAKVYLTCGYRSQDMLDALGDGRRFGVDLEFALEDQPAGTAGAVKLLEDKLDGTFVVASGDVLADVDIRSLVEAHRRKKAVATMALTTVDRPEEFGIVGLDDDGRIVRFKEKPRTEEVFSNLINAGIYVLEKEALDHVPEGEKFDFSKQLFPRLLELGRPIYGSKIEGLWKDIGRPRDLLDANVRMAERKGQAIKVDGAKSTGRIVGADFTARGSEVRGPAYVGSKTVLGKGSLLDRSAVGGAVEVGAGTTISDSFVMGGCVLGEGCEIKGSLLGEGCTIGPGARIMDSVLGDRVRLDASSVVENRTLE
ncbi:sugar phosphate nucleotidyltransferase [Methanomassiliicoccus luminyensis]|uniref:sugar phosphate nucleotidyltransferase n=1 Tax=Methanomassiliicoccus luminyensis TaxID=1080712 RepID=UPI000373D5F9|nr:NDP-sugar synthase [Methanomassiliicoccus luminyensis]